MVAKGAFSAVLLGIVASSCAAQSSGESSGSASGLQKVTQAIVGGSASDATEDATVMLLVLDPSGPKRLGICTAALIAPRLVLTARHCVSVSDAVVACNADGTPLLGAKVDHDRDPSSLYVFTGKDRPRFIGASPPDLDPSSWKPAGRGLEIIDDGASTLCDHDLALVLLEDPIENVPLASLRLDGDVDTGEKLLTVGWGVTEKEAEPQTRQRRGGVSVKRVGPSESIPILTQSEFLFDESICLGDSGGPVFSASTHAIVGVVSRGGNGLDPTADPASTCIEADNLATRIAPFGDLIRRAFEKAGAEPKLEPPSEESGCSMSPWRPHSTRCAPWLLAVGTIAALRRRRARIRSQFDRSVTAYNR